MSVQIVNPSIPVRNSLSNSSLDIRQKDNNTYDLLIEYNIDTQKDTNMAGFFRTVISKLAQPDLDEFPFWNSGNEPVTIDLLTAIPDTSLIQPVYLSGSEPETRRPTPANPQDRLTASLN